MIHKTAIVHPKAQLAEDVEIGPYTVIGENVKIGKGTSIGPHVVIEGWTEIGEENQIFQFASIGSSPQHAKYQGEPTRLKIGNRNIIREFATMNIGTEGGEGITILGDDNFFMAYSHLAHDCIVGNNTIFANSATLAGHVIVEDFAILGGLAAIHQFVRVGSLAMVGAGSMVSQDVPPYTLAVGDRAKLYGLNLIGLKRRKFPEETILKLKRAYRVVFNSKLKLSEAIKTVREKFADTPEVNNFIDFIANSKRGICR
ncbi:MAG: acyl-ACP--UDP-N-acetylglucosamine O-acyltransferase [Deltaproteobacteria bacterium]|nr:MAG: acyl-ACP--UDP-N-acetylglucosamine O-acyltransferase [Deltaproteobacteria bacterium]